LPMEQAVFNSTVAEMPKEFQRWGDPNNVPGQMNAYYQNHLMFMDDLACRPENMRNHLQSSFNLPQQVQVNLEVYPADAGQISISTLKPETYPWQGIYFDGVPIQIEAQALSGYVFSHWESNAVLSDTLNPLFNDTLSLTEQTFKAHFISTLGMDKLNNELSIFPNPADDFVTLHAAAEWLGSSFQIIDLSGKKVQHGVIHSSQTTLNLSDLKQGVYFLKLQNDAASIVKIVKL
ncbi:MAG: T9SS type A sorting domain-containing protein, partial [Bacteroidia bacterium]